MLAIFIIDASLLTVGESLDLLMEVSDYSEVILYYLAFIIALEFALRLLMGFAKLLFVDERTQRPKEPEPVEATQPAAEPEPAIEEAPTSPDDSETQVSAEEPAQEGDSEPTADNGPEETRER